MQALAEDLRAIGVSGWRDREANQHGKNDQ